MTGRDRAWLGLLALAFLAVHGPAMFRTGAGQDEDWYAVPGTTILRCGVPRIPYIPARDPRSACYKADVALYALPPLAFYLQAPVNLALGDGVGQARLAAALAGLAAAGLVYGLARLWLGDGPGPPLAAGAFVFSRSFLFPATTARPDMAAAALGLLAVYWATRDRRGPGPWRPAGAGAGAAAGLSLLAHPFGVVPAAQAGLATLARPGSWRGRLAAASAFAAAALGAFALWLPLIALHPDIFRRQFGGNVLHRAGPGLGRTLLAPGPVLGHQAAQFLAHAGPIQCGLYLLALAWCIARARRSAGVRELLAHLGAAALLLALFEGRHPTLGYYAYPAAFASVAVGGLAAEAAARLGRLVGGPAAVIAVGAALGLALLPGSGLRAGLAQARHLGDPSYDAHALARAMMAEVPREALVAVDGAYVLDFYLAGRRAVVAAIHPLSYDVREQPFEYAILGPAGLALYRRQMDDLVFVRAFGAGGDPFAPYAELYRRRRRPAPPGRPGSPARPAAGPFPPS